MTEFVIVDVFAEEKYAGNQLAVVTDAGAVREADMQRIALETNFSETTFVTPKPQPDGSWAVRIFTPAVELPFAGHPTVGTAWVIREQLAAGSPDRVVLALGVGNVPVSFERQADGADLVWMGPPAPQLGTTHPPEAAAALLGLEPDAIDTRAPVQQASIGIGFLIVPLRSLDALRAIRVDPARLTALGEQSPGIDQVFAFCAETHEPGNDLAARMFFEAGGIREDPATGSAGACLAGYLLEHGWFRGERLECRVEQGYEIRRPSLLRLRAERCDGETRVAVGGRVVPVARGTLL